MNPENQTQLAVFYLLNYDSFNIKDIINDSMFYKFQARLHDIEKRFGMVAKREKVNFINSFGRKSFYYQYSKCVSDEKLKEIFNFYK